MNFDLTITGGESIKLQAEIIQKVIFKTDTPDDSQARSTNVGFELRVIGKIIPKGETAAETYKLSLWSLVPAHQADCYRQATLKVINEGQVVRTIDFPNAFVVDYTEDYNAGDKTGTFNLYLRQKKDKADQVKLEKPDAEYEGFSF